MPASGPVAIWLNETVPVAVTRTTSARVGPFRAPIAHKPITASRIGVLLQGWRKEPGGLRVPARRLFTIPRAALRAAGREAALEAAEVRDREPAAGVAVRVRVSRGELGLEAREVG